MTWKPTPQTKTIGDARVTYLRAPGSLEGGHEVAFSDGRRVWVLPDGHSSGQKRSRMSVAALTELHTGALDPVAYLRARLHGVGLLEEPVEPAEEAVL